MHPYFHMAKEIIITGQGEDPVGGDLISTILVNIISVMVLPICSGLIAYYLLQTFCVEKKTTDIPTVPVTIVVVPREPPNTAVPVPGQPPNRNAKKRVVMKWSADGVIVNAGESSYDLHSLVFNVDESAVRVQNKRQ